MSDEVPRHPGGGTPLHPSGEAAHHPRAEAMASFVDGTLAREDVAAIADHLSGCSDCRTIVAGTEPFLREEEARERDSRRPDRGRWLAIAALFAVAAIAIPMLRSRAGGSTEPMARLVAPLIDAIPRDHRLVAARLAGFPWARLQAHARGDAMPDPSDLKLSGAAGDVLQNTAGGNDAASHHAAGVAYLLIGNAAEAVAELQRAADGSSDWRSANDLASARHAHAMHDRRAAQLPQALADVDRALRLAPDAAEAHFNRALILEDLGLSREAHSEWQHYLTVDPSSGWSTEAREHLRRESADAKRFDPKLLGARPSDALTSDALPSDAPALDSIVSQFPQEARLTGEATLLAAWADAEAAGDARAPVTLARARDLADALARFRGERLLADAVAAIEHTSPAMHATLVEAHRLYRDARIEYSGRRAGVAEMHFRRAATLFARAGSPMADLARYYAASAAYDQNRGEEASRELTALLASSDAVRHLALHAQIEWELAVCANTAGDWGAAVRNADAAATTFRALGERDHAAYLDGIAAMSIELIGEADAAWERRRAAFAKLSAAGDRQRLTTILHSAAMTLSSVGRDAAAESILELAAPGGPGVDATQLAFLHANGARYAARNGDAERARQSLARARAEAAGIADPALRERIESQIALADATLNNAAGSRPAIAELDRSIRFFTTQQTNIDLPDAYLQHARALRGAGDDRAAASDYAAALQEVEKQRTTIRDGESRLRFLDVASQLIDDTIELRLGHGDVAGAFAAADRARAMLDPSSITPSIAASITRTAAGAVSAAMPPVPAGVAVIEYAVLPRSVVAFCVTSSGITAETMPIDRHALAARVATFADRIRRRGSLDDLRNEAAALHRLLVAPLEAHLAGIQELVLVPDRQLYAVPFAALWDGARNQYLVEEFTLRFAPSASFRRDATSSLDGGVKVSRNNLPAVIVADPAAAGWSPLPGSREEATRIAAMYAGSTLLAGEAATRAAFIDAAGRSALIHYSGHANSDATSSYGALLLAGSGASSVLGSSDVARLHLRFHPLVVLAACGTFRGDALHVAGMSSLSQAFLIAGARGVIGTLWEIDDDVSATLFLRLHERMRAVPGIARALRAVQIEMLHSADPRMQHPATWSPVELLTDV